MNHQPTIFEGSRMSIEQAIDLTAESLRTYGAQHDVWAVAFSGGKDSTAMVTLITWLIEQGRVPKPRKMYVLYCDTRMELLPLWLSATQIMADLSRRDWIECRTVMAEMDQRFFVYMLGRGVPPPNNNTLRWCTAQIKVEPMEKELRWLSLKEQSIAASKPLMLIGVRIGESASRDARIAVACSKNGAECGQGWYQRDLPDAVCDKLSPLLHFRTCLIWDWLTNSIPKPLRHGFPTSLVAWAYGHSPDESPEEIGARTGCIGCPLAEKETALDGLLKNYPNEWGYLEPLKGLRPIYRELREPRNRLRQPGGESRKDGTLIANQNRMGPLTMQARLWALDQIIGIQDAVNAAANKFRRPLIDLLNADEETRIRGLIAANTWPNGWTGTEPTADLPYEDHYADGTRQLLLPVLPAGGGK